MKDMIVNSVRDLDIAFVKGMVKAPKIWLSEFLKGGHLDTEQVLENLQIENDDAMGVYAFWWNDVKGGQALPSTYPIALVGPKSHSQEMGNQLLDISGHPIHSLLWEKTDFPAGCKPVYPLYIGKTTTILSRLSQHLSLGTKEGWLERGDRDANTKLASQNQLIKHTTACQFRSGFEHLWGYMEHETTMKLLKQVSLSFIRIESENPSDRWDIKARFYLEDLAIGYYRPWFNVDSER